MFKIFQVQPRERLRETLPKPPDGMAWVQNPETRAWKLVPEEEVTKEEVEDPSEVTVDFHASQGSAFANPFGVGAEENTHIPHTNSNANSNNSNSSSTSISHRVVVTLPDVKTFGSSCTQEHEHEGESKSAEEADWELLSDRASGSTHSHHGGIAFVTRNGSISSNSFLHKRTPSSSTIDSNDLMNLGPTGKGILGVDYVEHVIMPTDTLQGICLAYKISASRLKRANHFSGESLLLAPKKLVIPISKQALRQGYLRVQDTDSKEYKMHAIQAEFPTLGLTEAKAYLELADWILKDAIQSAREDNDWEKEVPANGQARQLQPGEIRVMMNVQPHPEAGHLLNFAAQGAGYASSRLPTTNGQEEEKTNEICTLQPIDPKSVQAKAVKPEDIHQVSPTHNSFGVEMQALSNSKEGL